VALSPAGEVFVTDAGAHRVQVFDARGEPLHDWGGQGLGPGQFYRPRGACFDVKGRLIVVDHGNHRGQVFQPSAEFVIAFGPRGYTRPTRSKER
jgi:DNA-binding beta-propeller fold protein YncE